MRHEYVGLTALCLVLHHDHHMESSGHILGHVTAVSSLMAKNRAGLNCTNRTNKVGLEIMTYQEGLCI